MSQSFSFGFLLPIQIGGFLLPAYHGSSDYAQGPRDREGSKRKLDVETVRGKYNRGVAALKVINQTGSREESTYEMKRKRILCVTGGRRSTMIQEEISLLDMIPLRYFYLIVLSSCGLTVNNTSMLEKHTHY